MLRDNTAIPVFLFILSFPNPYQKKNSFIRNFGRKQNLRVPQLQVLGFVRYEKVLRSKHSSGDLEGTFLRNNKFDFNFNFFEGRELKEKFIYAWVRYLSSVFINYTIRITASMFVHGNQALTAVNTDE